MHQTFIRAVLSPFLSSMAHFSFACYNSYSHFNIYAQGYFISFYFCPISASSLPNFLKEQSAVEISIHTLVYCLQISNSTFPMNFLSKMNSFSQTNKHFKSLYWPPIVFLRYLCYLFFFSFCTSFSFTYFKILDSTSWYAEFQDSPPRLCRPKPGNKLWHPSCAIVSCSMVQLTLR